MDTMHRVINHFGSQAKTASALGVCQQRVSVVARSEKIPAEWVLKIWDATGGAISPHEMRPDLYPDADYRPRQ